MPFSVLSPLLDERRESVSIAKGQEGATVPGKLATSVPVVCSLRRYRGGSFPELPDAPPNFFFLTFTYQQGPF